MAHLPLTTQGEERDDVELCRTLVKDYGIAIIPGTYCGFPGWIRVCYANLTPDMCEPAAERLQRGLHELVLDDRQN
jgi:aspartate/methionine/tyrosine aminotransferase